MLPHADPVHKVTIIPRGMALGVTMQLPIDDKHNYTRDYLNDRIAILLGGRIAEEITFGSMTTGAGNDLERATEMARKMVCEWGMSDAMGPLTFGKKEEQIFLGREIAQHQDYSEDTAINIDKEIKRIVTDNYIKARALIEAHRVALNRSPRRCSRARCSTPIRCGASWPVCRSRTSRSPRRRRRRPTTARSGLRRSGRRSCRRFRRSISRSRKSRRPRRSRTGRSQGHETAQPARGRGLTLIRS